MKILVVGAGGREHALAYKFAVSDRVTAVYLAPGNAGTQDCHPKIENVAIDSMAAEALVDFANKTQIDLTVIGPEAPLVAGIVDSFDAAGKRCLGPSAFCSQLEGSKRFCKDFFTQFGIQTAAYAVFTDPCLAKAYVAGCTFPQVIKADGLAAGKGVVITATLAQAEHTIDDMLEQNRFGEAGHRIVIEDFLEGEEASFIVLSDGKTVVPFPSSQDHKARDEGDKGPNTGGMGAYSPAPIIDDAMHARVMKEVIEPTLEGMRSLGHPYKGFLYAGLMISPTGDIKVLEFNCRFGDPETQPIMMRLTSDFSILCEAAASGQLETVKPTFDPRPAIGVVMASGGYPDTFEKGYPIEVSSVEDDAVQVFYAGVGADAQGNLVNKGGRVLCVTALGDTLAQAAERAYSQVKKIHWKNSFYRSDIGHRALDK